jgi:hypothetical protein
MFSLYDCLMLNCLQSQCDYAVEKYNSCCEIAIKNHGTPGSSGLTKPDDVKI